MRSHRVGIPAGGGTYETMGDSTACGACRKVTLRRRRFEGDLDVDQVRNRGVQLFLLSLTRGKKPMGRSGPKKDNRHYSYNESLDESPKLIEQEDVEIEEAVPAEENVSEEKGEDDQSLNPTSFED
jgi:hypothetical protein